MLGAFSLLIQGTHEKDFQIQMPHIEQLSSNYEP